MINAVNTLLRLACAVLICFAAARAEDLQVIPKGSLDVDAVVSIEGVNVYAILKSGIIVGTTPMGYRNLWAEGYSAENIGTLEEDYQYYFFQIGNDEIERLSDNIDVMYYDDDEAIAKTREKLDLQSTLLMKGLTHISFIPKPGLMQKSSMPSFNLLTEPEIEEIVNQISQAEYTAYIQSLQDFVTRYSPTDSCRSAELWALDTFADLGLETEYFPYAYYDQTWYNAIGRMVGITYPDSIYLIIGHIDATSEIPEISAPGAEDNGSGSACVLETARVLSLYDFNCTIEFVLVSGEEQGLYGSEAYAEYCFSNNRNIAGVLNFDMIAYDGGFGWDTNIYSDETFADEVALADLLAFLTDDYSTAYSIRVNTEGPTYGSDHYYFSYYGFPAPFSIDAQLWSAPDWYPWYHTTDDIIMNLDLDYAIEVVKGAAATLATVAGLWSPPILEFSYPNGLPDLINPAGGTSFRVEVSSGSSNPEPGTGVLYYSVDDIYQSEPMEVVSPNIYNAVFPVLECGVVVSFYVSVETEEGVPVIDPIGAPDNAFSSFSAFDLILSFEDDFNDDSGWEVQSSCSDGQWERGIPLGGGDRGDPPTDYDGSGYCYVTDNVDDDSDVDGGYTWLISPVFDLTGNDAFINYALWYTNNAGNAPNSDYFNVHVSSDNGVNWTLAETFGPYSSPGWTEQTFRVAEFVTPTNQVRVRFEASDYGDGSIVEAGIDAVSVQIVDCQSVPGGTVMGTVTDISGPIENVHVVAQGSGISDDTDINGSYILPNLAPGIYDISFSNAGYRDTTVINVEVISSETTVLDVVMQAVEAIPTLSEWGLIVLALLILAMGTVAVIRRRREVIAKN